MRGSVPSSPLLLLGLAACASTAVRWRGSAVAVEGASTRESSITGALERGGLDTGGVEIDRSFERDGFDGVPFVVRAGTGRVLRLEGERATLLIELEDPVPESLEVVDRFVPYFFMETTIPGVSAPQSYALVCKGGEGRLRMQGEESSVAGDLALTLACRTYAGGVERDETEIRLNGTFEMTLRPPHGRP